ncbi:MAG: GNAT family N-acetyltransferase [Nitrosomonas sp.]|nr:GNAT family N-acetyltransferase [Nitrosomonas sp.]
MKNNIFSFKQTSFEVTPETHSITDYRDHIADDNQSKNAVLVDSRDLVFPLNVYAYVLLLETGCVNALHYGLFKDENTTIQQAQQYSTDLILSRIPDEIKRILEVGVGLGTTLFQLKQQGYEVHGITPDPEQITLLQKRFGQQLSTSCQRLEDFKAAPGSFDLILFQESAQYIEPLMIFNQGLDLLPIGGTILILDEFFFRREKTERAGLHLITDTIALAERMGFELVGQLDLSAMAAPTLDHLLHLTKLHRNRLMLDLSLKSEILDHLDESNGNYRQKYANGQYGYALLQFRKKAIPKWRVSLLDDRHANEMRCLFEKIFGHVMSPEMWQWKYAQDKSRALGVWRENRLIAHYGGMLRDILIFGQSSKAVQIGDVMVDPDERGILTRKGPFFLMAATFQECYVGYGKPILTGYGFPNKRAMRVAERLGLYVETGKMVEIEWRPTGKLPHYSTRIKVIDAHSDIWKTSLINDLWHKMERDLQKAVVGIRDSNYVRYRYLDHPDCRYQLLLVNGRFNHKTLGLIVLRHDQNETEIMDLIAPLHKIPLMIVHARRMAGINQKKRLLMRITQNFSSLLTETGGTRTGSEIPIPAPIWSQGLAAEALLNQWWLTGGDMDFR